MCVNARPRMLQCLTPSTGSCVRTSTAVTAKFRTLSNMSCTPDILFRGCCHRTRDNRAVLLIPCVWIMITRSRAIWILVLGSDRFPRNHSVRHVLAAVSDTLSCQCHQRHLWPTSVRARQVLGRHQPSFGMLWVRPYCGHEQPQSNALHSTLSARTSIRVFVYRVRE